MCIESPKNLYFFTPSFFDANYLRVYSPKNDWKKIYFYKNMNMKVILFFDKWSVQSLCTNCNGQFTSHNVLRNVQLSIDSYPSAILDCISTYIYP